MAIEIEFKTMQSQVKECWFSQVQWSDGTVEIVADEMPSRELAVEATRSWFAMQEMEAEPFLVFQRWAPAIGGKMARKNNGPIYLCGPINGRSDEDCNGWRTKAKELMADFDTLDPMRRDYRGVEDIAARQIIENDKNDIDSSEGMLVYFDKPSFGTAMEIFYAFEQGLKIVAVNASGVPHSPWVDVHTHAITTDLAEGCEMLRGLLCS